MESGRTSRACTLGGADHAIGGQLVLRRMQARLRGEGEVGEGLMPRPGPRRPHVAFRASETGLVWIDEQAEQRGISRSEMIRLALTYAKDNMSQPAMDSESRLVAGMGKPSHVFKAQSGNALRCSPVWRQMIADVLGRPLLLSATAEASTRGAALLALESTGKIQSIEQPGTLAEQTVVPDLKYHARYREGLERQEKMYSKLMSDQL